MKNWKTTVLGIASGALAAYAGGMDLKSSVLGAALAAFGLVSKDHNVTGA